MTTLIAVLPQYGRLLAGLALTHIHHPNLVRLVAGHPVQTVEASLHHLAVWEHQGLVSGGGRSQAGGLEYFSIKVSKGRGGVISDVKFHDLKKYILFQY